MTDLESLSRRELQHLAKELSLCRGNAKSDLILQHAQAFAAKADGAEQIRVALSSLAGVETVTEATPAKSPVASQKAKPTPIITANGDVAEATKTTPKKSPKVAKTTPTSTPAQTPTASKKSPAEKNATKKSPKQKTPEQVKPAKKSPVQKTPEQQTKASPVSAKKTPEKTKASPVAKKTPEQTKASPVAKKTPEQTKASPVAAKKTPEKTKASPVAKKTPEQTKASPVAAKKTPEQAKTAAKKTTSNKASPHSVDSAKSKKPVKKAARDVGALVSSTDDLTYIGDGSRVRCATTGHEMKADFDIITAHLAGKRYQRARGLKASFSSYAPMFVPHPDETLSNMLWCNVTETAIPRDIERVKAHVKGSRYQKELLAWKEAEAVKAEEAKAAAAKKASKKRKRDGETEPATESSSDDAAASTEKTQTSDKPTKKRKRSRRSRK